MKNIFSLLFFLATSLSFGALQDSIGTVQRQDVTFVQYLVTPGETVYRISTVNNIGITQLMTDNPMLVDGLKVGQVILLRNYVRTTPNSLTKTAPATEFELKADQTHQVQKGDTYYGLSKKYGVPLNDLLEWNGAGLKTGSVINLTNPEKQKKSQVELQKPKKTTTKTRQEIEALEMSSENPTLMKPSPDQPDVIDQKKQALETPKAPTKPANVLVPKSKTVPKSTDQKPNVPEIAEVLSKEDLYEFNPHKQQVLIVPFDPHLYWSDADDEIMKGSNLSSKLEVRKIIRRRLNALLDPKGFENIHLVGGRFRDTLTDLNKIYSTVSYEYQDAIVSEEYNKSLEEQEQGNKVDGEVQTQSKLSQKFSSIKDKLSNQTTESEVKIDKRAGKYFGVVVKDPNFFEYFEQKYSIDYYIFINQFEVITDYDHCLDRTTENYQRYFIVHFSIFNGSGRQIAGNKFKLFYDSNSNNIDKITGDNMMPMADRILMELPKPY